MSFNAEPSLVVQHVNIVITTLDCLLAVVLAVVVWYVCELKHAVESGK